MPRHKEMPFITIPARFFNVSYVSRRIPGVDSPSDLSLGANCQLFAYELLRHFGQKIPAPLFLLAGLMWWRRRTQNDA